MAAAAILNFLRNLVFGAYPSLKITAVSHIEFSQR